MFLLYVYQYVFTFFKKSFRIMEAEKNGLRSVQHAALTIEKEGDFFLLPHSPKCLIKERDSINMYLRTNKDIGLPVACEV